MHPMQNKRIDPPSYPSIGEGCQVIKGLCCVSLNFDRRIARLRGRAALLIRSQRVLASYFGAACISAITSTMTATTAVALSTKAPPISQVLRLRDFSIHSCICIEVVA